MILITLKTLLIARPLYFLSPGRRLYFAQRHPRPHPSRVCVSPPGCGVSTGPDGPTRGAFYTPLPGGERARVTLSESAVTIKMGLSAHQENYFLTACVTQLKCLLFFLSFILIEA